MSGSSVSSSISSMTKSAGKTKSPTFTNRFSATPCGYLIDLSASCMLIFVGLVLPSPSRSNIDAGMRLMLAPRSACALRIGDPLMEQGMVKLPGSIFFCGSLLSSTAEHSSLKLTNCNVSIFLL
ncbi:hypothetical protein HanRHA438_Chr06g0274551 [Helianthus annuus]|nr:hypothetical protein HanRHA438_Chr06g0274551 [Helianthus annuus]